MSKIDPKRWVFACWAHLLCSCGLPWSAFVLRRSVLSDFGLHFGGLWVLTELLLGVLGAFSYSFCVYFMYFGDLRSSISLRFEGCFLLDGLLD